MNVSNLRNLRPGDRLISAATRQHITILEPARPSRLHGWRALAQTSQGRIWVTPTNVGSWLRATEHTTQSNL